MSDGHGGHGGGGHEGHSSGGGGGRGAAGFIEGLLGMGAGLVDEGLTRNFSKGIEEGRHFAPDGIKSSGRGGKGGGGHGH